MVAEIRERLSVSKWAAPSLIWRDLISKVQQYRSKAKYQVKISNRYATLENLDDNDNNKAWKSSRENIFKSSAKDNHYYELKQHKPWPEKGAKNH